MIGSKILDKSFLLSNTNATTFLNGDSTTFYEQLNQCYAHRILDILRVRVDRNASIEEATTDLISTAGLVEGDNGYNGEYAFPADLLKPVRFEVSYDGLTWLKAQIYDNAVNQGSEFNESQINADFSQSSPMVDFSRNSYKLRPTKSTAGNVTKGIKIMYEKRQSDFTSTTEPSEIEKNLQDILAFDLASLEFVMHAEKYSPQQITLFNRMKEEVEQRFLEFYKKGLPTNRRVTVRYPNFA